MNDEIDGVMLEAFKTPEIAAMVAELLKGEGIPAFVRGGMLQDEFALSQRAMNVQGVKVFVHPNDLERARQILAALREAGKEPGDPEEA